VTSRLRLDAKTVKVQVRTEVPAGGGNANLLLDKGSATIIIKPGEPMAVPPAVPGNAAAPAPATVVPAGGVVPAGNVVPAGGLVNPVVTVPSPASLLPNVAAPSTSLTVPTVVPQPDKK